MITATMKTIAIINAMQKEHEQLAGLLTETETVTDGPFSFVTGTFNHQRMVLMQSGIGKVNAAVGAVELIRRYAPDALVNTGVAGSLNAKLDICDLLVSKDAMYYDVDCQYVGYAPCVLPGMPETFEADDSLIGRAFAAAESIKPASPAGKVSW